MSSQKLFSFSTILKQTLWGGDDIARLKSLSSAPPNVGESWELSGVPGSESVVCGGECHGMRLTELLERRGDDVLGARNFSRHGTRFPLLVKFIDARQDLSVQVHPDDTLAMRRHHCPGKTEMWYVAAARQGAHLLSGFSKAMTPREYERRVRDCSLPDVLRRFEVREGDTFYLPAGRVHSIGAGCFVCEIQQTSDITYRIYDFGRTDSAGKPRQLHVEEARDAIDFSVNDDPVTAPPPHDRHTPLVSSPYFTTSLLRMTRPATLDLSANGSFNIVVCTRGACTLRCGHEEARLTACHTLLAAASAPAMRLLPEPEADILTCFA